MSAPAAGTDLATPAPRSRSGAGVAIALGAALAYGINVPFARLAGDAGITGADIVALRAGLMLAGSLAVAWAGGIALRVPRGSRLPFLLLGLVTAAVGLCYLSAVAFIPVSLTVTILYAYPLLILLYGRLFRGEALVGIRLAAFGAAFVGLVLAIGPSLADLDPRGLALAGAAAVCTAAQFILAAGVGRRLNPVTTLAGVHAAVLPIALLTVLLLGGPPGIGAIGTAATPIAFTVAGYVVGVVLHFWSLRLSSAAAVGVVFLIEPVIAVATAGALLGESLAPHQLVGSALVLAALALQCLSELGLLGARR